jgi:hypothetical protein
MNDAVVRMNRGAAAPVFGLGKKGLGPLDRSPAGRIRAADSVLVCLIWVIELQMDGQDWAKA